MDLGKAALLGLVLCLHATPTYAACLVPTFAFFPERNDNVVVTALTQRSASCVHMLGAGQDYRFTSVTPILDPEHGSLLITEQTKITYRPEKSFGGQGRLWHQSLRDENGRTKWLFDDLLCHDTELSGLKARRNG